MHMQCVTCTEFWRAVRACLTSMMQPRGYTVAGRCKISFELLPVPLDIRILLAKKPRAVQPPVCISNILLLGFTPSSSS